MKTPDTKDIADQLAADSASSRGSTTKDAEPKDLLKTVQPPDLRGGHVSDKRAGHVSDKVKFMVPEKMEPKPKKERQRSKGTFENV